jgi:hypothetical protein
VTGSPTKSFFVGTGNSDRTSKGWCLEEATFRMVDGSAWGTVNLTVNGKVVAHFECTNPPTPCSGDNVVQITPIKLAKPNATISWSTTGCEDETGSACTDQQVLATIEVGYELATPAAP